MDKKHLFSRLLTKAILMALWAKASLCGKSSLLEQSMSRTQSRPKTSVFSVPSVANNLFNLRNLRSINDLRACKAFYNCRETFTNVMSALQIHLFLTNKPNFRKSQMNVTDLLIREYDKMDTWSIGKNKPNSNPIQTQFKPNQSQYKANTNPNKANFKGKNMLLRITINPRRELQRQIVLIFKLPFSGIIEVSVPLRASVSVRRLCLSMRPGDRKCILKERNSRSWKSAFSSEWFV
jgi:hypothetical protein